MGFAKGNVSVESSRKLFIGVGAFKVHGVNLSKEELSDLYGREVENERQFVTDVDINGVSAKRARLNFTLSTMIDDKPQFITATYNLTSVPRMGSTSGKYQIIDEYGRTAWATQQEVDAHAIPTYSSGAASISNNYRKAYVGEEFLTEFLKAHQVIPNVMRFKDGKPVGLIENPADAEARLEHIDSYFAGDFSEINSIIKSMPENKVKLLCGVRTDDQNRKWQDVFINFPMRLSTYSYAKLLDALNEAKTNGAFANTEFLVNGGICDIMEYVENPTVITPQANSTTPANPWFQAK